MPLLTSGNDPLPRFIGRVVDHLADARPRTLQRLIRDVLAGLGHRVVVSDVHLFQVRQQSDGTRGVSLSFCWSRSGVRLPLNTLRKVPFTLFSPAVIQHLEKGRPAFVPLVDGKDGCSRLISALMMETQTSGYLLCPIHLRQQLCGVIGVAHSRGPEHISMDSCHHMRLIGKILIQSIRSVRQEARRKRQHRQWKKIADASCDFGMVVGAAGEILTVIPFGQADPPGLKGSRIDEFFASGFVSDVRRIMQHCLARGEAGTCEAKAVGAEGGLRWYHVRVERHETRSGNQLAMFLSDIDRRRSRHEELQNLREHLHRASRLSLLGQISTEFAHQINQPLQAILTYAGTMRNREQAGRGSFQKRMASIESILASVEQASQIVNRIREFSTRRTLTIGQADLCVVIQKAVTIARPRAEEFGVQLTCRTDLDGVCQTGAAGVPEDYQVRIDDVQTTHVIINLIVNAVEACSQASIAKPRVEVSLCVHDDNQYLRVHVRDNGPGLPQANPDVVFEKFRSTKPEGLGIGLAISRGVIEAQAGQLWAINHPEGGCTFCFTVRRFPQHVEDTVEVPVIRNRELPVD